jgi:hypothetical protein
MVANVLTGKSLLSFPSEMEWLDLLHGSQIDAPIGQGLVQGGIVRSRGLMIDVHEV